MTGWTREERIASARALADLALDFADRAHDVEADLIRQFRTSAASLAADLGPTVIESDDDEQLLLRADGALAGEVLDEDAGAWRAIDTPEDVAEYYDPTDLFLDLADAIVESYPELADDYADPRTRSEPPARRQREAAASRPAASSPGPSGAVAGDGAGRTGDPSAGAGDDRPAIATTLENLRRSGALTDAEFERLRSQLEG